MKFTSHFVASRAK